MAGSAPADSGLSIVRGELLSEHYLQSQLAARDDWTALADDPRAAQIESLFEKVKAKLEKNKPNSKGSNEQLVRDLLLNPVFEILGLRWSPGILHFAKQLDYALFPDEGTFAKAQELINDGKELDALRLSCGIVEAERWGKEFGTKPTKSDFSDPIFQLEFYLGNARRSGGPRWGVLTNGHTWRLYSGDSDPLRHDFLQIELPTGPSLFAHDEREAFKLLVYFFSVEALERGGRLDKIYEDATRQAAAITEQLRRQAFGAVELIASAIMQGAPKTPPLLAYEAALIQLFRLLFILKAEADLLLPKPKVSGDIAERIIKNNGESIGGGEWEPGKSFWLELHDIFENIATEYNGHLFESKPPTTEGNGADYFAPARALLESVTLPNQAVANAIDRLLRVDQPNGQGRFHAVRVDYSTLRVRELGTIYEGLLEWRLEPISAADLKRGSVKLLGDKRITRKVEPGDFTLVADQADRKATGSYYTPHYVVEFIGKNVLDPLVEEIKAESGNDPARIISRLLDQRILDPAMGSGHFLVFAVEHLAAYIFDQLGKLRTSVKANGRGKKKATKAELPLPLDASIDFIRARIAERCIYGVDINPLAVELAKLSLWIATAAKGVPLSFLDHHLRCGDSLLGVSSEEFHHDLFAQKLVQQMKLAVEHIRWINDSYTQTLDDIGKKEERLRTARQFLRRFRLTYDCQLALVFGQEIGEGFHAWLDGIMEPVPQELPPWLQQVEKLAAEFRFFHWELEFPEVWRDRFGRPLDATDKSSEKLPGFDVVLGNPPFVIAVNEKARHAYMKRWMTAMKGFHLLVPFFERAFQILRPNGRLGFIVSNAFAKREFGRNLVEKLFADCAIDEIADCGGLSFPGHGTPTCIVFGRAADPSDSGTVRVTWGLKGDLRTPPEDSPLWQSITRHHNRSMEAGKTKPLSGVDAAKGFREVFRDSHVSVGDCERSRTFRHPSSWSFIDWPVFDALGRASTTTVKDFTGSAIGRIFATSADDIFFLKPHVARRVGMSSADLMTLVEGEEIRDWHLTASRVSVRPYDEDWEPREPSRESPMWKWLWGYRQILGSRKSFKGGTYDEAGVPWYAWHQLDVDKVRPPQLIAFAEIATHTHFVYQQSNCLFTQTSPVMKLSTSASDGDHHLLAGSLNSSAASFWLKQLCYNKGAGEQEERDRFVYGANKVSQVPLPEAVAKSLAGEADQLAGQLEKNSRMCWSKGRQLSSLDTGKLFDKPGEAYDGWNRALPGYTAPHPLIAQPFDTGQEILALKAKSKEERERLRREMIALQEEMDWLVYAAYGLLPEDHPAVGLGVMDAEHPWEVSLGQRSFELASIHAGPPADWEDKRKALWLARLEAIRTNEHIARIEQPVYKRRWVPPDFEKEFAEAFKWWLREKAEFYLEHAADGGPVLLGDWAAALWKDSRVRAAAEAYHGSPLASAKKFEPILKEAVEEETVPDDISAFKTRHKQLRGKLNVPRERFRSLTARPGYYIWAGKTGQSS